MTSKKHAAEQKCGRCVTVRIVIASYLLLCEEQEAPRVRSCKKVWQCFDKRTVRLWRTDVKNLFMHELFITSTRIAQCQQCVLGKS